MSQRPRSHDQGARPREGALTPYLRAIQAHRIVFVATVLLAVAAAVLWTSKAQKEYSATTQILVTPLPQDNQSFLGFDLVRESGDPTRTVQTAAALLETNEAAARATKSLKDGRTGPQLLDSISVQPEGESNVLDVTATADTPDEAATIANAFAEASLDARRQRIEEQANEEIRRIEEGGEEGADVAGRIRTLSNLREHGDPTLSLAQRATPSDSPVGASAVLVIGLALLAGLAIGTGAAVILELGAHRIRDEEEALDLFPLPVLARVPVLTRADRRLSNSLGWTMRPSIREPFRTVATQLRREGEHRIVMLTSGSTGDGKTTSSINLAVTMAATGRRTILIDTDFRKAGIRQALQLEPETPATTPPQIDPQIFEQSLVEIPDVPNLKVFAPESRDDQTEEMFEGFADRLPEILSVASKSAEFVVVDTAPLGEISDALRVIPAVDDVVIVVYPGNTNRANFEIMRDLLERTGDRPVGMLVIGDRTGASSTYYGYGMERQRRGMPVPGGGS